MGSSPLVDSVMIFSSSCRELGITVVGCHFVGGSSELISFSFLFFGSFFLPSVCSLVFPTFFFPTLFGSLWTVFCSIFGAMGVSRHLPVRRHVLQAFHMGAISVYVACRFNPHQ
ncbi:hypothetical protein AMTRI_Chr04g252840 [Amborella trichopoda]